MTTTECWEAMLQAWSDDRFKEAQEYAEELLAYLKWHSDPPSIRPDLVLGNNLKWIMAKTACQYIVESAESGRSPERMKWGR